MNIKYAIAALAACTMLSGTALAEGPKNKNKQHRAQSSATSVAGGVAAAGRRGAVAGGVSAAQARQTMQGRQRRGGAMSMPNSASTSTTGAVYTDRRRGSAAINTNGAAAGSGSVRSSSEGEVYSSTDRQGSQADAYGVSDAEAQEARPQSNPN